MSSLPFFRHLCPSIQRTVPPAPGSPVPEASLSRDQPPPSKGTLGALLAGALGLNWEQLALKRPGRGRTAHRRSTPPGPSTAGTSLGGQC